MDRRRVRSCGLLLAAVFIGMSVSAQFADEGSETHYRKSDDPPQKYTPESEAFLQQARELYREGPSKAEEVVTLLEKAIAADTTNANAYYLLGLTYYGSERFDEALVELVRALELKEADGKTIQPTLRFHRARTLFELGRCPEARQILESHWAFWQDGGRLQERYEALYPAVVRKCGDVGEAQSE